MPTKRQNALQSTVLITKQGQETKQIVYLIYKKQKDHGR